MYGDVFVTFEGFSVKTVNLSAAVNMLLKHFHLSAAYAGRDVAQSVIVADMFVVIVRPVLTCLCGVKQHKITTKTSKKMSALLGYQPTF